jgi:translation initiation factor IF-2
MSEAGFEVSPRAKKIDNAMAREVTRALGGTVKADEAEKQAAGAPITVPEVITVKEFSEKIGQSVTAVITKLIENGVMATINEEIDGDTATIIAEELGVLIQVEKSKEENRLGLGFVEEVLAGEKPENLKPRPPIVAVMGHVDHGKTTLLDTIRKTNVAATESGAITQHIGAYQVEVPRKEELKSRVKEAKRGIPRQARDDFAGRKITFLDTPGHEAFAAMRARGANVTDIIVLVVAADDSVKPQTVEVINRAKLTRTPMVVAINKTDKPEANPEKVKSDLAELGVTIEEWGGTYPAVLVSAKSGKGIDDLLEVILLTAEVEELKANPEGDTVGVVIESHLSRGQGAVATVLIKNGTLRVGDPAVVGITAGKIRAMEDAFGKKVKEATPATPVRISGLSEVAEVGDILRLADSIEEAKQIAFKLQKQDRAKRLSRVKSLVADKDKNELNLILRADVTGSLEAILDALTRLESDDVKLRIVDQKAGEVTDADVQLAKSTGSTIIAFQARVSPNAAKTAKEQGVGIDVYEVIYELVEDVTQTLLQMIPVEIIETVLGRAKIKAIFRTEKKQMIVGGEVAEGKIVDKKKFRIFRAGEEAGSGKIEELQAGKVEVSEVRQGKEFGMKAATGSTIKEGDVLEVFDEEVKKKTLK